LTVHHKQQWERRVQQMTQGGGIVYNLGKDVDDPTSPLGMAYARFWQAIDDARQPSRLD
jgi:hypothetical protein